MSAYIDERGPYVLELASNADARRNDKEWPHYWAENLLANQHGQHAYVSLGNGDVIFFYPHEGDGEPRPIKLQGGN